MRKIILALLLICSTALAQETELRAIDANALPNVYINRYGTFRFHYPDNWTGQGMDESYRLSNQSQIISDYPTGMMNVYIDEMGIIDIFAYLDAEAEFLGAIFSIEEVFINGRYAVIASYEDDGLAHILILLDAGSADFIRILAETSLNKQEDLYTVAIDIAASVQRIDPEIMDIDTSSLSEDYAGAFSFRYPEAYLIRENENIVTLETQDFSDVIDYGNSEINFALNRIASYGLEGQHRFALYLQSKDALEETSLVYEAELFELLYQDTTQDFVYRSLWNEHPLLWTETLGYYAHQTYFPDMLLLIYELDAEHYLFIEAHGYGFFEIYALRRLMLNLMATVALS